MGAGAGTAPHGGNLTSPEGHLGGAGAPESAGRFTTGRWSQTPIACRSAAAAARRRRRVAARVSSAATLLARGDGGEAYAAAASAGGRKVSVWWRHLNIDHGWRPVLPLATVRSDGPGSNRHQTRAARRCRGFATAAWINRGRLDVTDPTPAFSPRAMRPQSPMADTSATVTAVPRQRHDGAIVVQAGADNATFHQTSPGDIFLRIGGCRDFALAADASHGR